MADSDEDRRLVIEKAGQRVHRGFYASSSVRTLLFYGTVLLVCFLGHVFVALGISLFFLRFYRAEIGRFLEKPGRVLAGKEPPALEQYRFEVRPPGGFKKA